MRARRSLVWRVCPATSLGSFRAAPHRQSVYELSDGSGLVLTVGKYVTPNGTDIDREGLQPDFRSRPGADAAERAIQACRLDRANMAAAPQLVGAAATQQR